LEDLDLDFFHCSIHQGETGVLIVNPVVNYQVVGIKDHKFTPDKIYVKLGDIVLWSNEDQITHAVTSDDNVTFKSDTIAIAHSVGVFPTYYSYLTSIAGTFKYYCRFHPSETGVLIVN